MKRYGKNIGLVLIGFFLSVQPVFAESVSRQQVDRIEKKAQDQAQKHKRLQVQTAEVEKDLNKLNQQMISAAQKLQQEETQTTKSEEELKQLEERLALQQQNFEAEYSKLAETLTALQNLSLHPSQSLIIAPLSPVDVMRGAVLMRESVPYLHQNAEKIKADLQKIEDQKSKVEAKLESLKKQKLQLQQQRQALRKMADQKQQMRQKLQGETQKVQQEAQKLAEQASDLRELLEKAEAERQRLRRKQEEVRRAARQREEEKRKRLEKEREEAIARLEAEQKQRMASGVSSGFMREDGTMFESDEADTTVEMVDIRPERIKPKAVNFAAAKGRLTRPVSGSVITSYGEELSKGVSSKGMVMKTRPYAQVVAPYDGMVIFSGPFKGYGNLIIVEHDGGYVSLLAGMETIETETGQMLLAGEPVGNMPDVETAKLYFEIRKDQKPINPAPWFGS